MNRVFRIMPTFLTRNFRTQFNCGPKGQMFSSTNETYSGFISLCSNCCNRTGILQSNIRFPVIFHACNASKDSDKSSDSDKKKEILEDSEFKSIIADFVNDFEIDEEGKKILEDIRTGEEKQIKKEKDESTPDSVASYLSISKNKFREFEDSDASTIYSYEEEQHLETDDTDFFHIDKERETIQVIHDVKRGVTGVYDVHELVAVLREEKMYDIAVIEVPEHFHYVDHMVLASAKSPRHLRAVAEFVVKFYKMKKGENDPFVIIEGEKVGSWKAIDLGNIVLHLFLEKTRTCYDIESLWLLDPEYDSGGHQMEEDDDTMDILKEQMAFLNNLKLNETENSNDEQAG